MVSQLRPSTDCTMAKSEWSFQVRYLSYGFMCLMHCIRCMNEYRNEWLNERTNKLHNCLFVGCLTSQQHVSVSQGRICTDNFTCCHTEIEAADQTFHLTQSQYTDTGPTNPSADPITPGAWQGSHWSANV